MFTMIVRMMKRQDGQRDIGLVSITYFDSHLLEESFRKCVNLEIRNCTFFFKSEVVNILVDKNLLTSEGENRPKAVERLARRAEVVLPLISFDQFMMLFVIYCSLIYF